MLTKTENQTPITISDDLAADIRGLNCIYFNDVDKLTDEMWRITINSLSPDDVACRIEVEETADIVHLTHKLTSIMKKLISEVMNQ